ncbi:MAG: aminopeptidase P family protein [Gammaproteobacteria bacterium]|nr:aminopeptidase P family protein [Gammaproteobacteria bacterium]NIR85074.1 aminopeptidase P family protein [Gammaproteobacteria bacterium]NIR91884.1 aminopeptidase P family protein [Gammaproteobacteria bacterium]NIU06121.1 aminopeptidase P family protein [Gammaproteobacteria bacterium]NIV76936.1 M24 family metallopeptidase [Gammaproteobacteria bacterium]
MEDPTLSPYGLDIDDPSELPPFPGEEYAARLRNVRGRMAKQDLDALLVSTPENIYYLSGLDHQGFFAFHMLIVPADGELHLITRAMERATVEKQAPRVRFTGHADSADPAAITCAVLADMGVTSGRFGIEKNSLYFPPRIAEGIVGGLPNVQWVDASGLVTDLRLVKSHLELEYTRAAAAVTDAMMRAAMETARPGVNERDVAAAVHQAMILAGGEFPGFAPFIRPTPRLHQEHTTWRDRELRQGEALLLEMAGSIRRYHAPMGRFIYLGKAPAGAREIEAVCLEAFDCIVSALRPGVTAAEVYEAWQGRVNEAGLAYYRRHHCGYLVGLAFPPSWTGGSMVVGLRHDSDLVLEPGMVFHLLSWLMGTGRGDYFISNTAILTERGCEVLTATTPYLQVL